MARKAKNMKEMKRMIEDFDDKYVFMIWRNLKRFPYRPNDYWQASAGITMDDWARHIKYEMLRRHLPL